MVASRLLLREVFVHPAFRLRAQMAPVVGFVDHTRQLRRQRLRIAHRKQQSRLAIAAPVPDCLRYPTPAGSIRIPWLPSANWTALRKAKAARKCPSPAATARHFVPPVGSGSRRRFRPANSASIGPLPTINSFTPRRAAFTLRNASISVPSPFSGRSAHTTPITTAGSSPHGRAARSPSRRKTLVSSPLYASRTIEAGTRSCFGQLPRHGARIDHNPVHHPVRHAQQMPRQHRASDCDARAGSKAPPASGNTAPPAPRRDPSARRRHAPGRSHGAPGTLPCAVRPTRPSPRPASVLPVPGSARPPRAVPWRGSRRP